MRQRRRSFHQVFRKYWMLFAMLLPGVAYLLVNNYVPMLGLFIAFKNINYQKGIFGSDWVGLKNFRFLFMTNDAWIISRNTLLYNLTFIVVNLVVAVALAIFLSELRKQKLARVYQSIILFPYLLSMVVTSYLAYAFLSIDTGLINNSLLPLLGMDKIMWYYETKYWPFILVTVNTWKQAGYLSIIYYAAIIGLNRDLYEAAEIDGAGRIQQIFRITIPCIKQIIVMMTLLQIGKIFYADFGLFYYVPMDSGPIYSVTNVIDTYVYRGLMTGGDIGMSAAAGLYQSIVGFVLIMVANKIVDRVDPESALY